jgi:hypothetical protein
MKTVRKQIACIFFQVAALVLPVAAIGQGSEVLFARAGSLPTGGEPLVYAAATGAAGIPEMEAPRPAPAIPAVFGIHAVHSSGNGQHAGFRVNVGAEGWYKVTVRAACEKALSGPISIKLNRNTRLTAGALRNAPGNMRSSSHDVGFVYLHTEDSLMDVEIGAAGTKLENIAFEKLDNADINEPIVSGLKIYPYPWEGRILNIMWPGEHLTKIVLIDRNGNVVLDFPFEEGMKNQASVMFTGRDIEAGVYFIQVHTRNRTKTVPVDHI